MKIKDLMIGDLVRIKGDIPDDAYWLHDMLPWQTIKVEEILSNGINPDWCDGEINDYIPEDAIEPIPLTAEILEKNGFEKICLKSGQVVYSFADDYYDLEAEEITDSIWRIEYFNVDASFPSCRDLVGFVHEIQHFLNSHIIEKEIEL